MKSGEAKLDEGEDVGDMVDAGGQEPDQAAGPPQEELMYYCSC